MTGIKDFLQQTVPNFEQKPDELESYCHQWLLDDSQIDFLKNLKEKAPTLVRDALVSILMERRDLASGLANKNMFLYRANEEFRLILNDPKYHQLILEGNKALAQALGNGETWQEANEMRKKLLGSIPLSISAGDVSNLKPVNDNLGHDAGDKFIKMVASGLYSNIDRDFGLGGFCGRVGGDEFSVLTKTDDVSKNKIESSFDKMNEDFADPSLKDEFQDLKVTLEEKLRVNARLDYATAHISEGILLYLDMCLRLKMIASTYCAIDPGASNVEFNQIVKNIVNITNGVADRRTYFRKLMTKLEHLVAIDDEKDFTAAFDRSFRSENKQQILALITELKASKSTDFYSNLRSGVVELVTQERRQNAEQQAKAEALIDKMALTGI